MAIHTKEEPGIEYPAMTATTLANTVMMVRVLFLIFIFFPSLLIYIYLPLGIMFVASILVAAYFYLQGRGDRKGGHIHMKTPFSIGPALIFTAFIAIVLFISRAALLYVGSYGLYLTSVFAGLADVNAVTVSTSQLASSGLTNTHTAVIAILLAVFVNLAVHAFMRFISGQKNSGYIRPPWRLSSSPRELP